MNLQTAEIFGNGMVLQQNKPVCIWGRGSIGDTVIAMIQNISEKAIIGSDGKWKLILPALHASENETLVIMSAEGKLIYSNVAVGEVWIAGGQSNMEFYMRYDKEFDETVKTCENKNIRFFDYPVVRTEEERKKEDFSEFGFWRTCNEQNLQYYSAVAYYFAENLQYDLDVPVGIVGCNCGGTRACCWMDEKAVEKYGAVWMRDYENGLKEIEDLEQAKKAYFENPMSKKTYPFENAFADKMMYGVPLEELLRAFAGMQEGKIGNAIGPWHEWRPSGLYHTMLENIMPYTVKGVIWYQGESDEDHPEIYADMMTGLIACWRTAWADELPFLTTMLAPFGELVGNGGKYYPILREHQEKVAAQVKDVWCAATGDVGSDYDIHPKEKKPVGNRLALLARGHVYQEDILCDAPELKDNSIEDNRIILSFANAEGGLTVNGEKINALKIYKAGMEIPENDYEVFIEKENMIIEMLKLIAGNNIRIEFAKDAYYEVNIYNESMIPMKPFSVTL